MRNSIAGKRSQVSIETIAAVGIATILFVFMCFFAYDIGRERQDLDDASKGESLCLRVSGIISGIGASSPGTEFTAMLDNEVRFGSGRIISVVSGGKESSCLSRALFTNGTSGSFRIERGNALFRNQDGIVLVQEI